MLYSKTNITTASTELVMNMITTTTINFTKKILKMISRKIMQPVGTIYWQVVPPQLKQLIMNMSTIILMIMMMTIILMTKTAKILIMNTFITTNMNMLIPRTCSLPGPKNCQNRPIVLTEKRMRHRQKKKLPATCNDIANSAN